MNNQLSEEKDMKVGVIGLGNMAKAIIGGIIEKGGVNPESIYGSDVSAEAVLFAREKLGINAYKDDNAAVAKEADILFLAVKPQYLPGAAESFKDAIRPETVIVSIVAGKSIAFLESLFGAHKIVRCMPNTPALVGEGCTAMTPNKSVSDAEFIMVKDLLSTFGRAIPVGENMMDAVVGVSGSAPAYVFMFIEAMADGAVAAGMPRLQAYEFAAQAVYGSAKLMIDTGKHPGELKDMVCSPAGTTIEAVKVLEEGGFRANVMDAVIAAAERNRSL